MAELIVKSVDNIAGGSIQIPVGHYIREILQFEKIGNRVVGGIKYGSSLGADDIVGSLVLNPNDKQRLYIDGYITPAVIYFEAVTDWNAAQVDIYIVLGSLE